MAAGAEDRKLTNCVWMRPPILRVQGVEEEEAEVVVVVVVAVVKSGLED